MAKEGFLIERPILGRGFTIYSKSPPHVDSDRPRLAQGYSRFRHQDLIAIQPILEHFAVQFEPRLEVSNKRTALQHEVLFSVLSES
jgi:hypothetical protein